MSNMAVAEPFPELTPSQLAARYGLSVAGARPRLFAYVRQLWAYRHFIALYADARLVASFNTARLGRLWQVLNPITNAAVYYLIFGVVLNTRHGIDDFIGYLCAGVFIFSYTQTVVQAGTQAISSNLGLIRALHFPRASLPIAMTVMQLQNLGVSMVVLAGIVIANGEPVNLEWLLLLPALALQTIFSLGLAMVLARMGAKMTDLKQLIPFVMRTWMYASGVMYSVDAFAQNLPAVAVQIVHTNPLLVYIELARHALLEGAPLTAGSLRLWLYGVAWALVVGIGGFIYFWRGEQEYGRG